MPEKDVWEWLTIVETDGPFLSKAALKSIYPSGLPQPDASVDDVNATFSHDFKVWEAAWRSNSPESYNVARDRWVTAVLRDLLLWNGDLNANPDASLVVHSPDGRVTVRPWATLDRGDGPVALVTVVDRTENLRALPNDGWAADSIDRMAALLRETGVPVGLVTDGQWWAIVSARTDVTTASGVFDASLWTQERPSRNAFFALAGFASLASGDVEKRLPALFELSIASAEQITEALGDQVRRAVELILQSMSDVHLRAILNNDVSPLPTDAKLVYEAAVTVMMRVVFLLFAEERGLLPTHDLYRTGYAIAGVRRELEKEATDNSPEALDHTWETWHRLLAVSSAVYNGASFEDVRMPAYGGSLFDPERFPWLTAVDTQGRLAVRVSDRAMLEVLNAVQVAYVGGEARHLSFRDLDVEQIGYVYEGLLGYTATYVDDLVVGLEGSKAGFEPEIPLSELEAIAGTASAPADFAKDLIAHLKKTQENSKPRTANQIMKAYSRIDAEKEANSKTALGHVLLGDQDAIKRLLPFHALVRRDLRGFPYVVPAGGLVMTESPQRANTGTHYTPRPLAEEVVLHALQPLVYAPGPLDTEDENSWVLKSSAEILELKVADIAVGSGAFLVAVARYLADRLVEARAREGLDVAGEPGLKRWAIREIVARCLYGADINGMAVEMCKLSLWLISMDPGKPFSFVDDRVFHGNSLLGVTTEAQLKAQHIYPKTSMKRQLAAFDVDKDIEDAARLRRELASGQVDDADPMRSTRAKRALLAQSKVVTAKLRDIADGIIATGLLEGGKPGRKLETRYDALAEALRDAYTSDGSVGERRHLAAIIEVGLTPSIDTGEDYWKPLHWIIEAPDVIQEHGGFDAVIGNPPFLSGKRIANANGSNIESWLKIDVPDTPGSADLSAHFVRRGWSLLRANGVIGLITTDRISQGDSAALSTQIVLRTGEIFRARPEFRWPGKAATRVAIIWARLGEPLPGDVKRLIDGTRVPGISGSLRDISLTATTSASQLQFPYAAGAGVGIYGEGFILEAGDPLLDKLSATELTALRPFVNGQTLMSGIKPSRMVIDVGIFMDEQSLFAKMPHLAERIRATVKPVRDKVTSQVHEKRYWAFWDKREALFKEIAKLERFIVVAGDTRVPVFLFSNDQRTVYSHKVVLIASDKPHTAALLSSAAHTSWIETMRTGRGSTTNYVVSRILRTFPLPSMISGDFREESVSFLEVRDTALEHLGPTELYNQMDDPSVKHPSILSLREAQISLDRASLRAYGWDDLIPSHEFSLVAGVRRFTVSMKNRDEIRKRLLALNHRRAAIEAQQNPKKAKRGKSLEESEKPEGAMF